MYLAFRQACTNDKYYDKTVHAQTDPHVCIWRESAGASRMQKQTFSVVLKYGSLPKTSNTLNIRTLKIIAKDNFQMVSKIPNSD